MLWEKKQNYQFQFCQFAEGINYDFQSILQNGTDKILILFNFKQLTVKISGGDATYENN